MADFWKIPELNHWWLPDDEGYPPIVREIREWTAERVTDARDTFRESVRDLKAVFGNMSLEDCSSAGSSPSANSSTFYSGQSPGNSQSPEAHHHSTPE